MRNGSLAEAPPVKPGTHKRISPSGGGAWAAFLTDNFDTAFFWLCCVIFALVAVLTLTLGCVAGLCAACTLTPVHRLRQGNRQEKPSEEEEGAGAAVHRASDIQMGAAQRRRGMAASGAAAGETLPTQSVGRDVSR